MGEDFSRFHHGIPRWVCDPFVPPAAEPGEHFLFPDPARLPLIVGAWMSLSFPGLIAGVPLWRSDFTLIDAAEQKKLRRCLFSDGGLSSNFPIHFFDHLLPNSPTFAILLDDYDPKRNYDSVWLPQSARSGIALPVLPFSGLGGFLARLLFSVRDWRDNLQSTPPGYRERIAHVVLQPDEGGLNLTMDAQKVQKLVGYGQQAGVMLRDKFDRDGHRSRRFLVAMTRMEETLDKVAKAYDQVPGKFGRLPQVLCTGAVLLRSERSGQGCRDAEARRGAGQIRCEVVRSPDNPRRKNSEPADQPPYHAEILRAIAAEHWPDHTACPAFSSEQPVIFRLPSACCSSV